MEVPCLVKTRVEHLWDTPQSIEPKAMSEIRRLVADIETKIVEARKANQRFVVYDLPRNFDVQHMTNAEAQTVIYGTLIDQFARYGGYRVSISITESACRLALRWGIDSRHLDKFKKIINDHKL